MSAATPIDAAALIVVRDDGRVLVGVRSSRLKFLGGYIAFPGGRVDDRDPDLAQRLFGQAGPQHVRHAAALRELQEEMGLVVETTGDGRVRLVRADHPDRVASPGPMADAGRWVTPDYSPIRFDTQFFLLSVIDGDEPVPVDGEMDAAHWANPAEVLAQHRAQSAVLPPPTLEALRALVPGRDGAAARMRAHPGAQGEEHLDFEPLSGIRQLPLRTPTLPPATTTNCYVLGHERLLVVDPATYDADERDKLLSLLEHLTDRGAVVDSVVLTHHHPDHIGAAEWISAQVEAPIRAHAVTRDLLEGRVRVDETLDEGDVLDLGRDAAGEAFRWGVLFTPGHAPGHIVLDDLRPQGRTRIVGDMVAAIGTIIVDPPQGDMHTYIEQLRRLREGSNKVLMPAHGPPILDGHAKLDHYVAHRLKREGKVWDALVAAGEGRPEDLLARAYDDTPSTLYPLAARACLAHLLKLVRDGRAVRRGDAFAPAPRP